MVSIIISKKKNPREKDVNVGDLILAFGERDEKATKPLLTVVKNIVSSQEGPRLYVRPTGWKISLYTEERQEWLAERTSQSSLLAARLRDLYVNPEAIADYLDSLSCPRTISSSVRKLVAPYDLSAVFES